jgi:tetratricopeptide (TPR) repeat protein
MSDGEEFEVKAYEAIKKAIENKDLGLDPEQCKVLFHPKYFSRDRNREITVDIAIEVYSREQSQPSIIWIWECKDYLYPIPVKVIEEFHSKLEQIGADKTKGTLLSSSVLQHSALNYAISKGIGVAILMPDSRISMNHAITAGSMFIVAELMRSAEQGFATEKLCDLISEEVEHAISDPTFIPWTRSFYGFTPTGLVEPTGDLTQYIKMGLISFDAMTTVTIATPYDGRPLLAESMRFTKMIKESFDTVSKTKTLVRAEDILSSSRMFQEKLNGLNEELVTNLVINFDASIQPIAHRGWLSNYVIITVNVNLPQQAEKITREFYGQVIDLCEITHVELGRDKTFYQLNFLQADNSYCVTVFFDNGSILDNTKDILYEKACLLLKLWCVYPAFRVMYDHSRFAFISYDKPHTRTLAIPLEAPLDFSGKFPKHIHILDSKYNNTYLSVSGLFLGNASFIGGCFQEAIAEWLFSLQYEDTFDAYFNIACAYSKLNDMERAYEYCKQAVQKNVSRELVLNDPDLENFRNHPLYQRILAMIRQRH